MNKEIKFKTLKYQSKQVKYEIGHQNMLNIKLKGKYNMTPSLSQNKPRLRQSKRLTQLLANRNKRREEQNLKTSIMRIKFCSFIFYLKVTSLRRIALTAGVILTAYLS